MTIDYYQLHFYHPKKLKPLTDWLLGVYETKHTNSRDFQDSVKCMAYNLARAVKFGYNKLFVLLGRNLYPNYLIINGEVVKKNLAKGVSTVNMIRTLETYGLVDVFVGSNLKGNSVMTISDTLNKMVKEKIRLCEIEMNQVENVVILHDEEKNSLSFETSPMIQEMIDQLLKFNKLLAYSDIKLENDKIVKLAFKRIFNRGSFELGGRFYTSSGIIQTLSQDDRAKLTINDESTIEIDFKGLHLALLYEHDGIVWKDGFDPYNIKSNIPIDYKELSEWSARYNINQKYNPIRNMLKLMTLIMLNSSNGYRAIIAMKNKMLDDMKKKGTDQDSKRQFAGIDYTELADDDWDCLVEMMDDIRSYHGDIDHYFNSDAGIQLMNVDSKIMAGVLSDFLDAGKICIPIHDSAIVAKNDQILLVD